MAFNQVMLAASGNYFVGRTRDGKTRRISMYFPTESLAQAHLDFIEGRGKDFEDYLNRPDHELPEPNSIDQYMDMHNLTQEELHQEDLEQERLAEQEYLKSIEESNDPMVKIPRLEAENQQLKIDIQGYKELADQYDELISKYRNIITAMEAKYEDT